MARRNPRTVKEVFVDWLGRNLSLIETPWSFAGVTAVRLVALLALVVAFKLLFLWDGTLPSSLDISFLTSLLLASFSIVMSWAFYHSAKTGSEATTQQLLTLLQGFQQEMRGMARRLESGGVPEGIAENVERVARSPFEEEARFALLDNLIDESVKQTLVLMHKNQLEIAESQSILCDFILAQTRTHSTFNGVLPTF